MKKLITFSLLLLLTHSVWGYSVFTLKPIDWSQVRSVDVFVVGYGAELGNQFLYSAITKARVMDEQYPDSRAQVILWAKEKSRNQDTKTLEERDLNIIAVNNDYLTDQVVLREIKRLNRISSLHIISHNAAFYGSRIQSKMTRIDGKDFPWKELRDHFITGSYAILHGCNTGFILAPEISREIKRPVLGSLSSTDFQELFTDNSWYHNNQGQYPRSTQRKKVNDLLYTTDQACWKGNCHRLMSNNHPYRGYWGQYEVGLPFFKSFCNYREGLFKKERTSCFQGIAEAIRTWPTIESKSYEDKVIDFLCPRYGNKGIFKTCRDVLQGRSQAKIFWGETLSCDLEGCNFSDSNIRIEGALYKSVISSEEDQGNRPFLEEYKLLQEVKSYY